MVKTTALALLTLLIAVAPMGAEQTAAEREVIKRLEGSRWLVFGSSPDPARLMIHSLHARKHQSLGNDHYIIWMRADVGRRLFIACGLGSCEFDHTVYRKEIDCRGGRTKELAVYFYMGESIVPAKGKVDPQWWTPPPDSGDELLITAACPIMRRFYKADQPEP